MNYHTSRTHSPACCVAATVVCAVRWCSAGGPVGEAASAGETPSQAGWPPRVEVAWGPTEQMVSKLPDKKKQTLNLNWGNVLAWFRSTAIEVVSKRCEQIKRFKRTTPRRFVSPDLKCSSRRGKNFLTDWKQKLGSTDSAAAIQDKLYPCWRSEVRLQPHIDLTMINSTRTNRKTFCLIIKESPDSRNVWALPTQIILWNDDECSDSN